jgi:hypothetical protein
MTKLRRGHCYQNCFDWAYDNGTRYKTLRVVHGYPFAPNSDTPYHPSYVGHAWLEWAGWCFDPTPGGTMSGYPVRRRVFYDHLGIDPELCRRYTPKECAVLMLANNHYGPFHDGPSVA